MKKVFSGHRELAHVWAQQNQSEGKASRMFFDGEKLYSYGRHFCIARILPSGVVVWGLHRASISTSKHQSHASYAVNHRRKVYCQDPDRDARHNGDTVRRGIERLLKDADEKPRIRQATRDGMRARALHIATQFNEYLAALPDAEQKGVLPINTDNLADVAKELERQRRKDAAELRKLQKQQAERQAKNLDEWRTGSDRYYNFYALPPALRLKDGEVQTSHGAVIPVSHAKRLWPVIEKVRAEGKALTGRDFRLGHYTLDEIKADGSIVVGCHNIDYSEIERIAKALGLLEEITS